MIYKNVYPQPEPPYNLFPYIVLGWLAVGLAIIFFVPGLAREWVRD